LKTFLEEIAEDIVHKFGAEMKGIELIFPNKRTDFHFKRSLGKAAGKTIWAPKAYTIQKWVGGLTGLTIPDKLSLLFELFHVFKRFDQQFSYDFDSFYKLGEIILHDFNEIDNYLVDAKQIFTNIKNLHEIDEKYGGLSEEQVKIINEYWMNFSPEKKSREKEQFLLLWNILPEVYQRFSKLLLSKKIAYEGLVYKQLTQIISNGTLIDSENIKLFIGFNALNQAQKKLFKYLKTNGKALFYWDNDSYYHHNKIQEAGDFLRKNYEILSEDENSVPGNFKSFQKTITRIGIPGKIGQAMAIPQILKNLCNNSERLPNPEKTVVVLPDENMLFPVLNSIPAFIEKLNITMGYPLKNTSLYSLLIYFIKVQQAINQENVKSIRIYHKDVLAIINHSFIRSRYVKIVESLNFEITQKQMVYVNNKILLSSGNKMFEELFTPVSTGKPEDSAAKILNILFILFTQGSDRQKSENLIEFEYIYHTYIAVKRLHEVFRKESERTAMSFNIAFQFIKQVLGTVSIPFESESTDGLQIMGLIETRNLDFENIILLNANEGILPKLSRPSSLISESMRHAFELPVLKYQDSIFAYFFYRLLQRAKNIYILYDNLGSSSRSGELSRFVYQLELESGFEVNKLQLVQNVHLMGNMPVIINKTKPVLDKLHKYLIKDGSSEKQLTASSIDKYLNCTFQFYLRYIAGIKEPEKVEEEFSPVEMGLIIHSAMELLYKHIMDKKGGNKIEKTDFIQIREQIEPMLVTAFQQYLNLGPHDDFEFTGNLLIIKEVILKYLNNILDYDQTRTPFEIMQLEDAQAFYSSIEVQIEGNTQQVGIRGIIDRIDKKENEIYVIDYKTGKAEKEFSGTDELFKPESLTRKKAIAQILLYGRLVQDSGKYANPLLTPYIYDIRKMYHKAFNPAIFLKTPNERIQVRMNLTNEMIDGYIGTLSEKIGELFNSDIPFKQTEIAENCSYCPYKAICGKDGE
jgi:CRISPR/Cas system-associated exonuclease Cas4 (RecB family)